MSVALATPPAAEAATVQEITSPGGISAWLVEDYTVPIIAVNVAFRGGSLQDPEGKEGVANLMSGMLDEGAGDLDSRAFQAAMEDLSINISFDARYDDFYGTLRTLSTNADAAFDLFRLAVSDPHFAPEPVERIRGQIIANLRQDQTNPNRIASHLWMETMFGEHPYGRPSDGTVESVSNLTADDLKDFHRRIIAKDNLHVVIVGAIDAEQARRALDTMFGDLPQHADLFTVSEVSPAAGETNHADLSVPQTAIRLGGPGLKRDDPDYIAAYVADQILGGGTFSSRLYKAVREDRGLAYSVGTSLLPFTHAGAFVGATSVDAANADKALQIMLDEIARFATDGPTEEELASAKDYLIGNFALRFDSSRKIARHLLNFKLDGLGVDYLDKRNDLIRAVTIDDVRRAARRVWSGDMTIVTVGPEQT